jgi:hypothetical protein
VLDSFDHGRRQRLCIDFETKGQGLIWSQSVECLMKLKLTAPKGLVPERIETKNLTALLDQLRGVRFGASQEL